MSARNEYGVLRKLALRHATEAFGSQDKVDRLWQAENYHCAPDYGRAAADYETFAEIIQQAGAEVIFLPHGADLGLDGIYVRDSLLSFDDGVILCAMGKDTRRREPEVAAAALAECGLPIKGSITGDGCIEGGDFVWLDEKTCVVGLNYRTNQAGADQLAAIFGPEIEVRTVDMPHYKGPDLVFHLMSILSPLDQDLALVYSPLMPVGFRTWLKDRGIGFVEVPDEEFETMGCNVLALGPRKCMAVDGCPETRRRLEAAGCEVLTYPAGEISRKGEGGPTCLTRPLERS